MPLFRLSSLGNSVNELFVLGQLAPECLSYLTAVLHTRPTLTFQSPVVTICTARFNIQQFYTVLALR